MITVTSLTDHRINKHIGSLIIKLLKSIGVKANNTISKETSFLIVTNGMLFKADKLVLETMKVVPSIYLSDDHSTWIPDIKEYPLSTVYTQFLTHPLNDRKMGHFEVGRILLADSRFDNIPIKRENINYIYWGAYKPERHDDYIRVLPNNCTVIGKRYPIEISKDWNILPFTKDLDSMYEELSKPIYTHTYIFGDSMHNGNNFPWRIYEAFMCGIIPLIDHKLLGNRSLSSFRFLYEYLDGTYEVQHYKKELGLERVKLAEELKCMIEDKEGLDMNNEVEDILKERASIYGSYEGGVSCRATILRALNIKHRETHNGQPLSEEVTVVFSDIILKLMRAASDPTHKDSWVDLAGYAKLINDMKG